MSIRRFRADYIKSDGEVGIGIVEYGEKWESEVLTIHSIYSDKPLSSRDIVIAIIQRIYYGLEDDEHAILQMQKFSYRKNWHQAYKHKVLCQNIENFRGRMYHASLLAEDALRRKSEVSERFDEPMQFSIVQTEKQEGNDNY